MKMNSRTVLIPKIHLHNSKFPVPTNSITNAKIAAMLPPMHQHAPSSVNVHDLLGGHTSEKIVPPNATSPPMPNPKNQISIITDV
mmetsp:Transcript_2902/g.371  ORF Transcript_2902/g.371 Transcript_2902/m.371 type:complete len:85 (-) Transcript_2902:344-598(-)